MLAVLLVMIILVIKRDNIWLQRLKVMLGITIVVAAISVFLDGMYFPNTVLANLRRLIMLGVCLFICPFRGACVECSSRRLARAGEPFARVDDQSCRD